MLTKNLFINIFPVWAIILVVAVGCDNRRIISSENAPSKPNIILIMADDLGYSDLGCYGGEIQTPNIDYLASNGLRYSSFYNTSRCCPTRAALLTGLYNHQAGIGEMTQDRNLPGYRGHLTENSVTLAEVLITAGYQTGMVGKWHVSNTVVQENEEAQLSWLNHQTEHPYFSPLEQYPTNRGFDHYFGNIWGVVDFFDPFSLVNGTDPVTAVPQDYYHTDAINDTTVAYIRKFSGADDPFFIYVAHTAPHWPLHALPEDIEKYKDTYTVGWEEIRETRYQNLIELGLIDPEKNQMSPRINAELDWDDNPDKEWDAHAMAVHAAMIDRMDQGIGRIIDALRESGELENTLIVFLSDNGASPENAARYGPGFDRPSKTRSGETIAYPVNKEVLPGPQTTFASIGPTWANVSNTPFRFAKESSYEGGIRTPMVAFWPKGIKNAGTISNRVGHVVDFMATVVELAGATYPEEFKGNSVSPMAGISLAADLEGLSSDNHDLLFNEHFGAKYVRQGDWKLVAQRGENWKLYQLSEDETELNELTDQYPEKLSELEGKWKEWAETRNVFPKEKSN